MRLFHKHRWEEISRRFTAGVQLPKRVHNPNDETARVLEKIIFGFTVIELKCNECGELKHTIVIGDALKEITCGR